jgi:aryl-alcohol dehydrogenase-like predicted oxidoreductase
MQYQSIPGLDKPVSRLVQGTMMFKQADQEANFALLDAAYELGCTIFDTAHGYSGGDSERVLGQWLRERNLRDQIVVLTKGAHHNQDRKRVTPFDITADIFDSLARLQTDYIDLYLLHRDNPAVPVGPIVEILNEHQRAGRIRTFGGSNWSIERLREANAYAAAHDLSSFETSSPNYSLADQLKSPWPDCVTISGPQNEPVRAWYIETQMPLFTWSSLAGGFFSGRFNRTNIGSSDNYFDKLCAECYGSDENFTRLERAETLAQEKGLSLPQIALAFVLNQPLNISTIVGSRDSEEFKVNAEAAEVKLSPQELAWLDLKSDTRS